MRQVPYLPVLLLAACATAPAPEAAGPTAPAAEEATFTLMQGTNTLVTERFRRTMELLDAELTLPNGARMSYSAQLRNDASVASIEMRQFAADAAAGAQPVRSSNVTFSGDSAHVTQTEGENTQTLHREAAAGAVPYVNPSPSLMEQIIRRARSVGGSPADVAVWIPSGGGQNARAAVTFSADSAQITIAGTTVRLHVDAQGRVLGGVVPSQGITLTRTPGR